MCSQNAAPGAHGWNMKSPSSLPTLRWSRFFASSSRVQVRLEVLVAEERRAVDPLHRLVLRVALPVGARRRRQLEGLQLARRRARAGRGRSRRRHVLDRVARDLGPPSSPRSARTFSGSPRSAKNALRLVARPASAARRQVARGDRRISLLDASRGPRARTAARRRSRSRSPSSMRRADAALRAREQLEHRRRQQVRRAVAIEVERLGIARGEDLHARRPA